VLRTRQGPTTIHYLVLSHEDTSSAAAASSSTTRVTADWVLACARTQRVVDVTECILYTPLGRKVPLLNVLGGVGITQSLYTKQDRTNVLRLAQYAGAEYNAKFSKEICSILVAMPGALSDKVTKCLELGVPIVNVNWLIACVAQARAVPLDAYYVGESVRRDVRSLFRNHNHNHSQMDGMVLQLVPSSASKPMVVVPATVALGSAPMSVSLRPLRVARVGVLGSVVAFLGVGVKAKNTLADAAVGLGMEQSWVLAPHVTHYVIKDAAGAKAIDAVPSGTFVIVRAAWLRRCVDERILASMREFLVRDAGGNRVIPAPRRLTSSRVGVGVGVTSVSSDSSSTVATSTQNLAVAIFVAPRSSQSSRSHSSLSSHSRRRRNTIGTVAVIAKPKPKPSSSRRRHEVNVGAHSAFDALERHLGGTTSVTASSSSAASSSRSRKSSRSRSRMMPPPDSQPIAAAAAAVTLPPPALAIVPPPPRTRGVRRSALLGSQGGLSPGTGGIFGVTSASGVVGSARSVDVVIKNTLSDASVVAAGVAGHERPSSRASRSSLVDVAKAVGEEELDEFGFGLTMEDSQVVTYDDDSGRQERARVMERAAHGAGGLVGMSTKMNSDLDDLLMMRGGVSGGGGTGDRSDTPVTATAASEIRSVSAHVVSAPSVASGKENSGSSEATRGGVSRASRARAMYFQFTSVVSEKRKGLETIVRRLKARVDMGTSFNESCTHVIVGESMTKVRSEKFLCALAGGLFVLPVKFLTASSPESTFVLETEYETDLGRFWRDRGGAAFDALRVLVCLGLGVGETASTEKVRRILQSGRARTDDWKHRGSTRRVPPFDLVVTTREHLTGHRRELENVVSADVPFVTYEYVVEFLLQRGEVSPKDYNLRSDTGVGVGARKTATSGRGRRKKLAVEDDEDEDDMTLRKAPSRGRKRRVSSASATSAKSSKSGGGGGGKRRVSKRVRK